MSTEIELKVRAPDRSGLVDRLAGLGAEPLGRVVTGDVFLDTDDNRLLAGDSGLRLRSERRADKTSNKPSPPRTILTYKGPRAPGPLKRREEIELSVGDLDAAVALFERLGYRQKLRFEKERQSWRLGGCRVELDRVPHLGHFLEIEGPDEERIAAVRRDLQLEGEPPVRESYAALLDAYLTERGITSRDVRFGVEDGSEDSSRGHPRFG